MRAEEIASRASEEKNKNKFKPQMMPKKMVALNVITPMTTVDIHF
jgi:hypothetical protein